MPTVTGPREGDGVQAVVLALRMLEFLAQSGRAVGVSELARAFGTTKSRIHRHLQTLVGAGYIGHDPDTERYRVSARLMALGQTVSEGHELSIAARPAMLDLRERFGHSLALSVPEREGMRIIATLPGNSNIDIGVKPGSLLGLHNSAQGKIALAFGAEGLPPRLLDAPLAASTPYTLIDPLALAADVARARARGWSVAPNEALIGMNALAAPILDALGRFVAALALVDSIQFIPGEPSDALVDGLLQATRRVSGDLGWRPAAAHAASAGPAGS